MFPGSGSEPAQTRIPPAFEIQERLAVAGLEAFFAEPVARVFVANGYPQETVPGAAVPIRIATSINDAVRDLPNPDTARGILYRRIPEIIAALVDDSRVRGDAMNEAKVLLESMGLPNVVERYLAETPIPQRASPPSALSQAEAVRTAEALGELIGAAEQVQVLGLTDTTVGLACSDIEYGETSDRGFYLQVENVSERGPVTKLLTPWGALHLMGTSSDDRTPSPPDAAAALDSFREQLTLGEPETLPAPRAYVSRYSIRALRGAALPEPRRCAGDYREIAAAQWQWESVAEPIVFRAPELPSQQQASDLARDLSALAAAFDEHMSSIPDAPRIRFDQMDHDGERSYNGIYRVTSEGLSVGIVTPWGTIPIRNDAGRSLEGARLLGDWSTAGFAFQRALNENMRVKNEDEYQDRYMRQAVISVNETPLSESAPAAYPKSMTPRDRSSLEEQWQTVVAPRIVTPPPRPAPDVEAPTGDRRADAADRTTGVWRRFRTRTSRNR